MKCFWGLAAFYTGLFAMFFYIDHEPVSVFMILCISAPFVFIGLLVWQAEQVKKVSSEDDEIWLLEELYNENRRKTWWDRLRDWRDGHHR